MKIKLSKLLLNSGQIEGLPKNPRFIKDDRYEKLKQSLIDAPEMTNYRGLLVFPHGDKYITIGGNMRLRAARELGWKEIECIVIPEETPVEKLREYTIKDNVAFGSDDWDSIANEWDIEEIEAWGAEIPISKEEIERSVKADDFDEKFNSIKDDQVDYPIVPQFMEKHEAFILLVDNEVDENFVREVFGLNANFKSVDGKIRKSNVINVEKIREIVHSGSDEGKA